MVPVKIVNEDDGVDVVYYYKEEAKSFFKVFFKDYNLVIVIS